MKALKIVFASMALPALLIAFSSFTSKSYNSKAFARECFQYNAPFITGTTTPKNRVAPSNPDSIVESEFKTTSNWSSVSAPSAPSAPSGCNNGSYVCTICFDNPPRNLQTALNNAWSYYVNQTPDNFTHATDIDAGPDEVRIFLKSVQ